MIYKNNEETNKLILKICGKHLALEKLRDYIEQSSPKDEYILLFAIALNRLAGEENKKWHLLRHKFNQHYAPELCRIFGIERKYFLPEAAGVTNPERLIYLLATIREEAIEKDFSINRFVNNVKSCFDIPYSIRTLRLKFKDYEELIKNQR